MKGIIVTNGTSVEYANDQDLVVDTRKKGGMKTYPPLTFDVPTQFTYDSTNNYYYYAYPHNLGYVPAVIGFVDGRMAGSWQNAATVESAASADNQFVYMSCELPRTKKFVLIIFAEKVSDV